MSRRWLYNIPRSLETRGYRPLGRVALVDHSQRVLGLIDQKLQRLGALAGAANDAGRTARFNRSESCFWPARAAAPAPAWRSTSRTP